MKILVFTIMIMVCFSSIAQLSSKDSLARHNFYEAQKQTNQSFNDFFNQNLAALYGADETTFIRKIDSLRNTFILPLDKLKKTNPGIGNSWYEEQYTELNYTFDKFILDYVPVHKRITGKEVIPGKSTKTRLANINISNASLLKYEAFRQFLQSVLEQKLEKELDINREKYRSSDNQRLDAGLVTLRQLFSNSAIQSRMRYELLRHHIENYGVKNISSQIHSLRQSAKDIVLRQKLDSLYNEGLAGRKGHLIETYKQIGDTHLDLHIFEPAEKKTNRPAIIFFHGGGWSEGMPDWFFSSCEAYAKKGWVAVAVEYRLRNRHGSLPPAAIEDGKSAIRYLRNNASRLNIDTSRIVASGNSAGANLALATAVIDTLDKLSEDLGVSSRPDAVMLNSVSTDFTNGDFWQQYIQDKS
ncbi:MAG: alpha/beta hydrolase, partial [Chitinophagaceae bacterium]|nr:alpha/beta hydrolase [Chitinophagaceae bacterium]